MAYCRECLEGQVTERKPLGQGMVENMPRGVDLEMPDRGSSREAPFMDEERRP